MGRQYNIPERLLTAYHEAGHALVCHVAFGNVAGLSLRPDARTLGRQSLERPTWTPEAIAAIAPQHRAVAEERALAGVWWCLAGQAAESLLVPRYQLRADEDVRMAHEYVTVAMGADTLGVAIALSWPRLRRWLRKHRLHLDVVARALAEQEELSGEAFYAALAEFPLLRPPRVW